jgi:hypothetical protein
VQECHSISFLVIYLTKVLALILPVAMGKYR